MPEVTERPILFSREMVNALRAGRKTQTRRIIRLDAKTILSAGQRKLGWTFSLDHVHVGDVGKMISALGSGKARPQVSQQISVAARHPDDARIPWDSCGFERVYCPYGSVGDRLWVRETFLLRNRGRSAVYRADMDPVDAAGFGAMYGGWKPSIFMPRKFSRLTLELTAIRVQRLHDIDEEDARAEGVGPGFVPAPHPQFSDIRTTRCVGHRPMFQRLWREINGPESWAENPWVWALGFKILEGST